jgi:2,6-dihydroxypyridine 3-monooxygenase
VDRSGHVEAQADSWYRFSSYFTLYEALVQEFGDDRYHLNHEVVGFDQDADHVVVELADGTMRECDLLVCADGIRSSARDRLVARAEREYAGYVAWRGTLAERDLAPETSALVAEAIVYGVMPNSHILAYPIPGLDGSIAPGRRFANWIWYRNLPAGPALGDLMTDRSGRRRQISLGPGDVRAEHVGTLREASRELVAPQLASMICRTDDPFVQVVFDVEVSRLAFGRICLIGDAACVLRPHVAVGTAKAAHAARKLAEAVVETGFDIPRALHEWEPVQLEVELGALARTRQAGVRAQFENAWRPGEPLPFGLHEQGDSRIPI